MTKIICDSCGEAIEKIQYVYEVKLDDGTIKHSHGGACLAKFSDQIKRIPIKAPDWWIRSIPNPADDEGITWKEIREHTEKLAKQTHEMLMDYLAKEPERKAQLAQIERMNAETRKILDELHNTSKGEDKVE